MGKIFCVMGKSSSGKDSIYREIMAREELPLKGIVGYTTRPIREGETPGREYIFCDEAKVQQLAAQKRIVELRAYDTVCGVWKYFTVDDDQIDLDNQNYLYIVTLEGFLSIQKYFGSDRVVPIYIEVEDGERLLRAIARERQQKVPGFEEMCRRFLADSADFSNEKLEKAGIERRFENIELETTIHQVTEYIRGEMNTGNESQ